MPKPELLIIGGGIVGLCAAITAAENAMRVTLIDAGINAGTTANAGSLHVQLQSRFMRVHPEQAHNVEASLPMYLDAVREWDRLEQMLGSLELVRKGGLMLAEDAEQLRFLENKAQREAAAGLKVELLDKADLAGMAPWLGPQIIGAELCHDEGKLNPLLANARLRDEARRLSVEFIDDRATDVIAGKEITVRGERDSYRADQLIVAAAWGSGDLLRGLGLALPTKAEPLHMNITEAAKSEIPYLIQHAERSITVKQLHNGQIVIGGGWPARSRGQNAVPEVIASSMLGNVALAGKLMPGLGKLRVIRTWAGMNTTVDGKTVLGRLPKAARIIVAVPGDAGYTLGPLCGRLAAQIATDVPHNMALDAFSPSRFARG